MDIIAKDFHANGSGEPFVVAIVDDPSDGDTKLVIMFEELGHIAVLSLDRLIDSEDISVKNNSHHADRHEDLLRDLLWED
jgi:hypothetical protein